MNARSCHFAALLFPLFWLVSAASAPACVIDRPKDLAFLRKAELVMRAKIIGYERKQRYSEFKLAPVEVIRGPTKISNSVIARWINSTFGEPAKWTGPTDVLVGLDAVFDEQGNPVSQIVQQSCGPESIYPDNPEFRCEVVNLLYAYAPKFNCPKSSTPQAQ
jgi:hypothetical protein